MSGIKRSGLGEVERAKEVYSEFNVSAEALNAQLLSANICHGGKKKCNATFLPDHALQAAGIVAGMRDEG